MSRLKTFGRIDRYVAKLFALSYLTAFFLVVGLFLILDMATKLDDYLQPGDDGESPPIWMVAQFYLLEVPFLYLQMSPFVTLVAGLFTTARLAKANEIVAVLNAGISARRLLAPVFLGATLLALGMVGLREWATAELGRQRDVLQDQLVERRDRPVYENFWIRDVTGLKFRVQRFEPAIQEGDVPRLENLSLSYREGENWIVVSADAASWDAEEGRWELEGGLRIEDTQDARNTSKITDLEDVVFTPADAELSYRGRERPEGLSLDELSTLLDREQGSPTYRTLFHYNMTFPLAGLVLLLVGLPFLVAQERGRAVERVAKGFFLCLVYFGVDFVSRTLGIQGSWGRSTPAGCRSSSSGVWGSCSSAACAAETSARGRRSCGDDVIGGPPGGGGGYVCGPLHQDPVPFPTSVTHHAGSVLSLAAPRGRAGPQRYGPTSLAPLGRSPL